MPTPGALQFKDRLTGTYLVDHIGKPAMTAGTSKLNLK
jgi:hypothetical protein